MDVSGLCACTPTADIIEQGLLLDLSRYIQWVVGWRDQGWKQNKSNQATQPVPESVYILVTTEYIPGPAKHANAYSCSDTGSIS